MGLFSFLGLGASPNDGNGDGLRAGGQKINANYAIVANLTEENNFTANQGFGTATPRSKIDITDGKMSWSATGAVDKFMDLYNSSGSLRASFAYDDANARVQILDRSGVALISIEESTGNFGIGKVAPGSKFAVSGLPVYANNAAALVGGLTEGDFYKTASTGDAQVMVTNAT